MVGNPEKQEHTRMQLDGLCFQQAMTRLALRLKPLDPKLFKVEVERDLRSHPFNALQAPVKIDLKNGQKITQRPSLLTYDEQVYSAALEAEMFAQATLVWTERVVDVIVPAIQKIAEDHPEGHRELYPLVCQSSFVPPGHEQIFVEGLRAGLEGDFMKVVHYLAPQVENSIRSFLEKRDILVSSIDDQTGEQMGHYLAALLQREETAEQLEQGTAFELRGVLCEKSGYNLRNLAAHGMLSSQECRDVSSVMLWWLVLRCVVLCLERPEGQSYEEPK